MAARSRNLAPKLYQRFLQVCEQWPVDKTRSGRDLGEHIKENFRVNMKRSIIDSNEAERMLDGLVKISSNYYKEKYPRKRDTGFSTDVAKEAGAVLTTQYQNQIKKRQSIWGRLLGKK